MLAWRLRLLSACTIFSGCFGTALAQPVNFICPKAGTVEVRSLGRIQYTGSSATDPYVCKRLNIWGKPQARLFNFYPVGDADYADVRAALSEIFSGKQTRVSFNHARPPRGIPFRETWTFLRRENVTVAGKTFNTIVFDREELQLLPFTGDTAFHAHDVLWFDPETGLWVKAQFHPLSGEYQNVEWDYEDLSIIEP
jgi:hypothetical protein